jgi:hypothetical protein
MHVPAGTVFADLTVIQEVERSGLNRRFMCRCTCGRESVKFLGNLRLGRSTSCGCLTKSGEVGRAASVAARRLRARITDQGRMCHTCQTWKAWSDFCNDPRRPNGKASNCFECARWRSIKGVYGINRNEWERMREGQGGACALCGDPDGLMVDHDHSCCQGSRGRSDGRSGCKKCIRGLLCDSCNRVLGRIEQKPALAERFSDYLCRRPLAQ